MWQPLLLLARSFRTQLTLWYVAILAILLVAAGSYVYFSESHALLDSFNAQLETRIDELEGTTNQQTGLLTSTTATEPGRDQELVMLLTPHGQIVQSFGSFSQQSVTNVIAATIISQGNLRSTHFFSLSVEDGSGTTMIYGCNSSVMRTGGHDYFLVVGLPSDVPRQQQQLLITLLVALPIILLLATVGGLWLANHALQPVQTITRAAQQISESDLHRRLRLARHDELGELAATFDHMLDRLENAFERQRQFTADASHELRTPLTIIDLEANYALTQPLTLEECQQAITLMQQEARTMARLVNNLLILARADSGQMSFRRDAFDLAEVVLEVVERLSPLAAQQGMTITLGALPELVLLGDRQFVAQALSNLVENALKYVPPAGNQVCLSMGSESKSAESAELWAWVRVADNGPGIAAEHLPHLFERFYRVDQARTRFPDDSDVPSSSMDQDGPTGSGLGLCITQWIVEIHGGQIHVQSTLGQGTTFEVWLPIRQ